MPGRFVGWPVVLGPIHDAGFQRLINFGKGHGRRVATQLGDHAGEEVIVHDPNLHTLNVGGCVNRLFTVIERPRTRIIPGQRRQAFGGHPSGNCGPTFAVQHTEHVRHILEDEGQGHNVGFGHDGTDGTKVEVADLKRACAHLFDGIGLAAQCAAVEHLQRHFAAGFLGQKLCEFVHGDGVWIAIHMDVPAAPVRRVCRHGNQRNSRRPDK
mmetsp:Transcript_15513/g.24365  ORF Transcript_15513/g.24365 Transcript_15513/m.24365 type:complete len:211 (-) Transcript_15513:116-748(-)